MAIDSIGSNASVNYTQLLNNTSSTRKASGDDSSGAPGSVSGSGKFADAINQTLAQLGVSASNASSGGSGSATDGSSASSDQGAATSSFADNLFAALQGQISAQAGAQGAQATQGAQGAQGADAGSSGGSAAVGGVGAAGAAGSAAVSGGGHHHHGGGGGGKVAGGLQNLIQQLSTSSDSVASSATGSAADSGSVGGSSTAGATDAVGSTPATAATTSTASTASTASGASALQDSYNALVAASGASGSNAPSLTQFLQTLSQNLQGAPTSGNVVSTKA